MKRALLLAVALPVVLVATVVALVPAGLGPAGADTPAGGVGWRTERWHGLQVRVPASWGWGTAPVSIGQQQTVCGDVPGRPYVGRPIATSDACSVFDDDQRPDVDSVWLGVDLEPGADHLGGGWVRETIEAEGSTVTVTSRDADLRVAVLGSATGVTRCAPALDEPPRARRESTVEGVGDLVVASLCAYARDGGEYRLVHGERVGRRLVGGTARAVDRSPVRGAPCSGRPDELVVVTARYGDDFGPDPTAPTLTHRFVYELGACSQVRAKRYFQRGQVAHRVGEATVVPWATPRFRTLLTGPRTRWAYEFFIGVQG